MTILLTLAVLVSLQGPVPLPVPRVQGAISGRILSADGSPAAGMRVGAMDTSNSNAASGPSTLASIALTGEDGRYRLEGLAPGRYTIFAGPLVLPTYYPGGTSSSSASVIPVAAGATVANVDFSIAQATEGFKVSGRVVWHDRKVGGRAAIALVADGFGMVGSNVLAADGAFEFSHVNPGMYMVFADIPAPGVQPVVVTVLDKDVTGLEVVVPRIIDVRGIAIVEDGQSLPSLSMLFSPESEGEPGQAEIQPDGTFDAQLPEGAYRLLSGEISGYYFKSLTAGSLDLLQEPLRLTAADSPVRIVAVLARAKPVSVSGRVTGPAGSPLPSRVELSSGIFRNHVVKAAIQPDGTFTVSGVAPGTYMTTLVLNSGLRVSAATVAVPEKDVTGIEIVAPRLREIMGRVSVEGNGPLPTGLQLAISGGSAQQLNSAVNRRNVFGPRFVRFAGGGPQLPDFMSAEPTFIPLPPDGPFHFTLPEGEYHAEFINSGLNAFPGSSTEESAYDLRAMTYGGANLLNEPMKVSSTDSAELRVTLIPNARIARFKVAGRVVGLDSGVQRATRVRLTGGRIVPLEVPVAADGSFELAGVPRGLYTAHVIPANALTPSPQVRVVDRDVTGIAIRIPLLREIAGRVTVEGKGPPAGFVLALEDVAGAAGSITVTATPRLDGTFQIMAPEGSFRVRVNGLPNGYAVKSLTYGKADLLREPLLVTADVSTLRATIAVDSAAPFVKVGGRVTGVNTAEVTRIALTGMAVATMLEAPITNGAFEFSGVAPGVYLVSVFRSGGSTVAVEPPIIAVAAKDRPGIEIAAASSLPGGAASARLDPAGNEAAAVANLRTINTAEVTFLSVSGGEFGDLPELIEAGLIDDRFQGSVSGYVFAISATGPDFIAAAAPVSPQAGTHGFFSTPDGVIRFAVPEPLSSPGQAGEPVQ